MDKKALLSEENKYQQALNDLLLRYSKDGKTVFEKVHVLDDYAGYTGIYVLCIPRVKGYYIGQTNKSISKRIKQHFHSPSSEFDKSFTINDVSEIYVLHCGIDYLDIAEVDCIASIPKEYLLNRMAGGPLIMFVDSEDYVSSRFRADEKMIKEIVTQSAGAKALSEFNIRFDTEMADLKKAANKIKRLKPSSITYELCLQATQYEGEMLEYVPEELKTTELCLRAMGYSSDSHKVLQFVPKELRNKEICIAALQYTDKPVKTLQLVPPELLTEDFAEELVTKRRSLLKKLPIELQTERVVRAAEPKKKRKQQK